MIPPVEQQAILDLHAARPDLSQRQLAKQVHRSRDAVAIILRRGTVKLYRAQTKSVPEDIVFAARAARLKNPRIHDDTSGSESLALDLHGMALCRQLAYRKKKEKMGELRFSENLPSGLLSRVDDYRPDGQE